LAGWLSTRCSAPTCRSSWTVTMLSAFIIAVANLLVDPDQVVVYPRVRLT
jgi:hypothetical protein